MHPVSVLTFGIFLAGYITARWDLVTRLYELAIFAWDHGVIVRTTPTPRHYYSMLTTDAQTRAAKGFAILSIFFILFLIPIERIAARESELVGDIAVRSAKVKRPDIFQHPRPLDAGISAREQLRRRGSF